VKLSETVSDQQRITLVGSIFLAAWTTGYGWDYYLTFTTVIAANIIFWKSIMKGMMLTYNDIHMKR
jgi:hypothetical protein